MESDSEDEMPLTRINSGGTVGPQLYDVVPEDKHFPIKVIEGGLVKARFGYVLKEGKPLPYDVVLETYKFNFGKDLEVKISGDGWMKETSKRFTVFSRDAQPPSDQRKNDKDPVDASFDPLSIPASSSVTVSVDVATPEQVILSEEELGQLNRLLDIDGEEGNNVCRMCGFSDQNLDIATQHILQFHQDWKEVTVVDRSAAQQPESSSSSSQSVFLNQEWRKNIIENFDSLVIEKCSKLTKESWSSKVQIMAKDKFKKVRSEIIKGLEEHIMGVIQTKKMPTQEKLKEIIDKTLVVGYPWMFGHGQGTASEVPELSRGYGFGGLHGNEDLPKQMRVELVKLQNKLRREEIEKDQDRIDDKVAEESLLKKSRKPQKFGINNNRYYAKCSEIQTNNIQESTNLDSTAEREAVYQRNRQAICVQFRESTKLLDRIVRGFWSDPLHVKRHFFHLSDVPDLTPIITENWDSEMAKMEKYIEKKDVKGDYLKIIKEASDKCEVEYEGSKTFKDVAVIRCLVSILDKTGHGRALICLEGEEIATTGPFLLAKEFQRNWTFELWADKVKLLEGQSLQSAFSSYFEAAFSVQLKYPKECQTVSNIMQLRVAKYGDATDGTLTNQRKDTALNQVIKYGFVVDK